MKIGTFLCWLFGHKFNDIEWVMFNIECKAINVEALKPALVCRRCKKKFIYPGIKSSK